MHARKTLPLLSTNNCQVSANNCQVSAKGAKAALNRLALNPNEVGRPIASIAGIVEFN
jgi:hypothetical protein